VLFGPDSDWNEVAALAEQSYRHYVSKRLLARLDSGVA